MIRSLSVFFAASLLLACQAPSSSSSLPAFAEKPSPVPTVLQGGLGISFGMSESQVREMGFEQDKAVENKGQYGRIAAGDPFPFQAVVFTPISGQLSSIRGTRYYKKGDLACFKEMALIADAIHEKYPRLVSVEQRSFDSQRYMSNELCEAKSAYLVGRERNESGWQRCVSVTCTVSDDSTSLDIIYSDRDVSSRFQEERQQHLKANRDQRLKQINVSKDTL